MTQIASILLILVPAAYVWWLGRRLVRRIDDPAFAELRFANAQRLVFVIAASVAASLLVNSDGLLIKVVIMLIAFLTAGFPARRTIFEERWGLFAYLSHTLRFWLAIMGVWLLFALQPSLIGWSGTAAVPTAILLLSATLLWNHNNDQILPYFLRAVKLERPELDSGFQEIQRKARCLAPRLLEIDAVGGHWVNAFALPSRRRPAVLFTADLLEALTPAETLAIFAHEVAHLEYFDRRRLLRRELVVALLAAAPLAIVLLFGAESSALTSMTWIWPLAVLLVLAGLAAHNQTREHESDIRALELTDDPEPIITALTKIHNLMKMPRRWRADSETRMSHPSLARRLRAIRDAATDRGLAVAEMVPATEVVVRAAADPSQIVILGSDRLHWLHGVDPDVELEPAKLLREARDCRSIRYADLRDLRLEARGPKQRHLVAIDGRGDTLKLQVSSGDVEHVKVAIEHIDLKVEGTTVEASRRFARLTSRQRNARLLGTLACLFALLPPFSLPLLLTGGVLLARPSRITAAAAGAIALGAGLLGWRSQYTLYFGGSAPAAVILAEVLLGSLLLYAAFRREPQTSEEPGEATKLTLAVLGALAILYLVNTTGRLSSPLPMMQLHLWARYHPAFTLVLLGFGAALWCVRPRLARLPALTAIGLAATLYLTGTLWFRQRFGDDPLARTQHELASPISRAQKIRELSLQGEVAELRLAPSARRIAARVYDWSDEDYRFQAPGFQVELADGSFTEIAALDLAFLDEDRIAVIRVSQDGDLLLQALAPDPTRDAQFEIALPDLDQPALRVDADGDRWEITEANPYEGHAVLLSGDFQSDRYAETHWRLRESDDAFITAAMVSASGHALTLSQRYTDYGFAGLAMILAPLSAVVSIYDLDLVKDSTRSRLSQTALPFWCMEPAAGRAEFICASNDFGSSTRLWTIDAESQSLTPIGSLPGHYYQARLSGHNKLVVLGYGVAPVLIDLNAERAQMLDLEGPTAAPSDEAAASKLAGLDRLVQAMFGDSYSGPTYQAMALRGNVLALAFSVGHGSTVALYRLGE